MNRTKKITLKHKAKTKKSKPRNGNKPVYIAKADRLAANTDTQLEIEPSDANAATNLLD